MRNRFIKDVNHDLFQEEFLNIKREFVMQKEEILETLTRCGLNEYESKVYSSLVILGTSKARAISRESTVPQSKIYEILEQLMNKNLVEVFDGRPKEYRAVEPELALKNLLEDEIKEIEELKQKIDSLSKLLKNRTKDEVSSGVWTIKGEKYKQFFDKTAEMISKSDSYVYGITRDFSRSSSLATVLRRAKKRGVKLRLIGIEGINEDNYYKALWYTQHGVEIRVLESSVHPRIIVVDGREMMMRLDYSSKRKERFRFNSIWSEEEALVAVMDSYVKNLWKDAVEPDLKKFKSDIKH